MKIYFDNTELELPVNDESYRYRAVRGEHSLTLYFSLPEHVEIPVGAYCEFEGEGYFLERPENLRMVNTRNFEYTLLMDSRQARLSKFKFKDMSGGTLKFSLTAKPELHLQMLVDNLNLRDPGWSVGSCVDATEKVISYNHSSCMDALNQMADAFETEWEIAGQRIHLRKVEYNKDDALALSYGRGNGFRSGVGRTSGDVRPVEILYVQGGEKNIDASVYGGRELLLPKNRTLVYEGRTYVSDDFGLSIRRGDRSLQTNAEGSLDCTHIYPSRVGTVTAVEVVDAANHFYDFIDSSIPDDLDFNQFRIDGEKMTVVFQSGILTGKEFDLTQNKTDVLGYIHAERRFQLVPADMDGRTMPDEVFKPAVGDSYAVFGMMLPAAYVCDDATQTGASWNMFREAARYLYENEEQKFTFTGELDGIWAKKDWVNIGGKIRLGGYVLFSDSRFAREGVLIRIVGIKDFINNPHSPSIELSNEVVGGSIVSDLRKIESNEVVMEKLHREASQFTKRRYRDSIETMGMIETAMLEHFTAAIQPAAIRTMSMLVGDEGLQFRFVNGVTNPVEVAHNVVYNPLTKQLTAPGGIIQHLTLGISSVSSSHATSEYRFWSLPAFTSDVLNDGSKRYYLYARVSATSGSGEFLLSESAVSMGGVAGYYYLLVGALNSEYEYGGERSYVSLYGFTEVLPGRLTTNRVISSDGLNFIDFLNNAVRIGGSDTYLDFNSRGDGVLRLKGTLVQSSSGDEEPLGCFRGEYNSGYVYYKGDEVVYNGSTFLYVNDTAAAGVDPVGNVFYWKMTAARATRYVDVYLRSATQPAAPSGSVIPPSGWSIVPLNPTAIEFVWMSQTTVDAYDNVGTWSDPMRLNGGDGSDMEYVYRRTATGTAPAKPATSQTDDYVPSEWTDTPSGVSVTNMYEWASVRTKQTGVWGSFLSPALWAKWGEKGMDGDGYEYVYCRTAAETVPATPATSLQTDDYVPSGWTDNPLGTDVDTMYEWVSVRKKENGVWGTFSSPALWAKYGKNGVTTYTWIRYADDTAGGGMSNSPEGKLYIGFAYNRTTAVESDTASDYVWSLIKGTDGVPGAPGADGVTTYTWIKYSDNADGTGLYDIPTDSTEYIGIATNKTTATESAEKSDYRWSKFKGDQGVAGEKGADGVDGAVFEHRYAKNGSTSTAPALDAAAVDPPGWTTILPSVGDLEYLWMTTAEKSAAGDLLQNWSAPVRASGVDGTYVENRYWVHDSYNYPSVPAPGEPDFYSYLRGEDEPAGWRTSLPSTSPGRYIFMLSGRKTAAGNLIGPWAGVTRLTGISGKDGADGKSPALVYRGEYSSSETYYGTSVRVDAVKHGSTYYVARVDAGTFTNYVPTSAVKWNTFGAQFDSIATGLLIAETANIASWIFTNQQIESQDGKVCLNGANGTMSFGTDSNMTISTDPSNRMNARVTFSIKGSVVGEIGFSTYPYLRFYDGSRYTHLKGAQLQLYVIGSRSNGINLYVDSDGSSNVSFDKLPTSEPTAQDTVWRDSNGYLRIT